MIDLSKLEKVETPEEIQAKLDRAEAIAYLQSTDWQVIAKYERKREIPDDVAEKRAAALAIVTAE